MEKLSVKEYARRHKMSIFQVIKKINRGELKTENVQENGVDVQYILLHGTTDGEEQPETNMNRPSVAPQKRFDEKLLSLQREVEELRRIVARCCQGKLSEKK